jgi:hypothetical protein
VSRSTPAIDVVAVGFLDGTVYLLDVLAGEKLLQVQMGHSDEQDGRAITGVAFRDGKLHITSNEIRQVSDLSIQWSPDFGNVIFGWTYRYLVSRQTRAFSAFDATGTRRRCREPFILAGSTCIGFWRRRQ